MIWAHIRSAVSGAFGRVRRHRSALSSPGDNEAVEVSARKATVGVGRPSLRRGSITTRRPTSRRHTVRVAGPVADTGGSAAQSVFQRWLGARPTFRGKKRTVAAPAILGIAATVISFQSFTASLKPPTPPSVNGVGELYVERESVPSQMEVTFAQKDQKGGRSKVQIKLVFTKMGGKPVKWALVLYRDARFADPSDLTHVFLRPGITITDTMTADPPFRLNTKEQAQVIRGVTYPENEDGQVGNEQMVGWISKAVFAERGPRLTVSLPRYGRLRVPPILQVPRDSDEIDLGIPGTWRRPDVFQIDIAAGDNPPGRRIDVASPDVVDPAQLAWRDGESVRAILQRTDLAKESQQQFMVFALGAVVGAGVSLLMAALEKLIVGTESRGDRASRSSSGT